MAPFFIEVKLPYNNLFLLYNEVNQLYVYIYIYIYIPSLLDFPPPPIPFTPLGHHRP